MARSLESLFHFGWFGVYDVYDAYDSHLDHLNQTGGVRWGHQSKSLRQSTELVSLFKRIFISFN